MRTATLVPDSKGEAGRLIRNVLVVGHIILLSGFAWANSDPNRLDVRIDFKQEKPVWVGQLLKVPIVVLLAERSKLSPRLHLPEVPGGILMQVAGPPVYGKEGFRFTTWTYDLAFYAHRAGEHPVAPILVQAELPEGGATWAWYDVSTDPSFSQT